MVLPHVMAHSDGRYYLLADAALGQLILRRMVPSLVVIHMNPRPPTNVTSLGIFMDSPQMVFQFVYANECWATEIFCGQLEAKGCKSNKKYVLLSHVCNGHL